MISILVALAAATTPAPVAHAGERLCEKPKLFGADVKDVRREMMRAAEGRRILWKTQHGCTNPGNAYSGVDLQPKPQPDGAIIEPTVHCERATGPWECRFGENRKLPATPVVMGKKHKANFYLPPKFDADTARKLIQRSAELGSTLTVKQECGASPEAVEDQFTERRLSGVRKNFAFAEWITYAEIEAAAAEVQVRINDYAISFAPISAEQPEIRFLCWHMLLIL